MFGVSVEDRSVTSPAAPCRCHFFDNVRGCVVLLLVEQSPAVPQGPSARCDGTLGVDDRASSESGVDHASRRDCVAQLPALIAGMRRVEAEPPQSITEEKRSCSHEAITVEDAIVPHAVHAHRGPEPGGHGDRHAPRAPCGDVDRRQGVSIARTESSHFDVRRNRRWALDRAPHLEGAKACADKTLCRGPAGQFDWTGERCHLYPEVPLVVSLVKRTDRPEIFRPGRRADTESDDSVDIPPVDGAQRHQRQRPRSVDHGLQWIARKSRHGIHTGRPDGELVLFHPPGQFRQFSIHAVPVVSDPRVLRPSPSYPWRGRPGPPRSRPFPRTTRPGSPSSSHSRPLRRIRAISVRSSRI